MFGKVQQAMDGTPVEQDDRLLRCRTVDPQRIQPAIDVLRASGIVIRRVTPDRPSLEDLFIETVSNNSPGNAKGAQ
jgi:hypothetical protein